MNGLHHCVFQATWVRGEISERYFFPASGVMLLAALSSVSNAVQSSLGVGTKGLRPIISPTAVPSDQLTASPPNAVVAGVVPCTGPLVALAFGPINGGALPPSSSPPGSLLIIRTHVVGAATGRYVVADPPCQPLPTTAIDIVQPTGGELSSLVVLPLSVSHVNDALLIFELISPLDGSGLAWGFLRLQVASSSQSTTLLTGGSASTPVGFPTVGAGKHWIDAPPPTAALSARPLPVRLYAYTRGISAAERRHHASTLSHVGEATASPDVALHWRRRARVMIGGTTLSVTPVPVVVPIVRRVWADQRAHSGEQLVFYSFPLPQLPLSLPVAGQPPPSPRTSSTQSPLLTLEATGRLADYIALPCDVVMTSPPIQRQQQPEASSADHSNTTASVSPRRSKEGYEGTARDAPCACGSTTAATTAAILPYLRPANQACLPPGRVVGQLPFVSSIGTTAMAWSPDGLLLATTGSAGRDNSDAPSAHAIRLFRPLAGAGGEGVVVAELPPLIAHCEPIRDLTWSDDSRW